MLSNPRYEEQRLSGLREHAARQRQATLERSQTAVARLREHRRPITVLTVREGCGLDYKSIVRNPEAPARFQANRASLPSARRQKEGAVTTGGIRIQPRDPALNYSRAQLVLAWGKADKNAGWKLRACTGNFSDWRTQVDLQGRCSWKTELGGETGFS